MTNNVFLFCHSKSHHFMYCTIQMSVKDFKTEYSQIHDTRKMRAMSGIIIILKIKFVKWEKSRLTCYFLNQRARNGVVSIQA